MKTAHQSMGFREWGFLFILSVLWGGSFFYNGVLLGFLQPLTIVALRLSLAAVLLNLVLRFFHLSLPRDRGIWAAFIGMGLINNIIPFSLIAWGQTRIPGGQASILNATTPLFTVLAAHILTRDEKITPAKLAGVLIGFSGVVVMMGPEVLKGFSKSSAAQFAVLGAAVCYALAGIFGRRFRKLGIKPLVSAAGQLTASGFLLLPVALILDKPWNLPAPGIGVLGAILGLSLLSTALAYVLYFRILASSGATNVLLVTFLIPVFAILLGTLFLGESLELKHFIGMGCIGAGLSFIDGRIFKAVKLREHP